MLKNEKVEFPFFPHLSLCFFFGARENWKWKWEFYFFVFNLKFNLDNINEKN
jgi:hypothetical protein